MNNIANTADDIRAVGTEITELLIKKNSSYGDSALTPINIFSRLGPIEAIKVRIDDKLSRIKCGSAEFSEDTVLDLLGYLILLRIAKQRAKVIQVTLNENNEGQINVEEATRAVEEFRKDNSERDE